VARVLCVAEYQDVNLAIVLQPPQSLADVREGKKKWMPEVFFLYYVSLILKSMEALHGIGIVHGNITPTTLFVRNEKTKEDLTIWKRDSKAWECKGLCLGELYTCKKGSASDFQKDYEALCSTLFYLIFKESLKVAEKNGKRVLGANLPRFILLFFFFFCFLLIFKDDEKCCCLERVFHCIFKRKRQDGGRVENVQR